MKRGSGILLHISSLPSGFGIGDVGPEAYKFVDFLARSRQRYWQILPLNPTDPVFGNSPYSSCSAFALNTLFVSPELLVQQGWLEEGDIRNAPAFPEDRVDYAGVREYNDRVLEQAFQRLPPAGDARREFDSFCQEQAFWLDDFAVFVVLKKIFNQQCWTQWPVPLKQREPAALAEFCRQNSGAILGVKFAQFLAFRQALALKQYCSQNGVALIGDIPIYVNDDSADVWAHPHLFKLNPDGSPQYVAGVPPDYFSKTGQRWGNPVYNWPRLKEENYDFWRKRVRHNLLLCDYIRIDHFRGFAAYWEIPAEEKTAINGKWVPGPGDELFLSLREQFPGMPIIAEDLGIITPDVTALMKRLGFPGMKVLMFAFGGDLKTHPYIPENYAGPCLAYTGTHDNNTIHGWWQEDATKEERKNARAYLGKRFSRDNLHWLLIERLMRSPADAVILPMQDVLGLGPEARMNRPAVVHGNWEWRFSSKFLMPGLDKKLAQLTADSERA